MFNFFSFILCFLLFESAASAQLPPVFSAKRIAQAGTSATTRRYLSAEKILWKSPDSGQNIINEKRLLLEGTGQADLSNRNMCILKSTKTFHPALLLDFGKELQGGLQIVTGMSAGHKPIKLRIRFGESASEAMSDIDTLKNATNDHAMRDLVVEVPWLGKLEIGNTGFRFVRIDLVDDQVKLQLKEVRAIFNFRDLPYLGSFESSDSLLNKIWLIGAYTVHLNMQDYVWDGIKRDRLVWLGDMHPETSTIATVFGYNEVVPKTLDLARDITPLPNYMNGMVSYSMWWVIIQRDWYMHQGDLKYLKQQKTYLKGLLTQLISKIDSNGKEQLNGQRFLDWPSSEDPAAIHSGLQAMLVMTLQAGQELSTELKDLETAQKCAAAMIRLKKHIPNPEQSKQAAAMLSISGLLSAQKANQEVIAVGGIKNFSTFFGYYMLQAKAKAGDYQGSLDAIRTYWGAMIDLGATTFWEDFDMNWLPNAARIDELVPEGKIDIHSAYGGYCYKGFRLSLAHGWAAGPTPWLTEHVLGIQVMAPGCRVIKITPHLGDLKYAKGSFPTPLGILKVKHVKLASGKISTQINAPKGIRIIR